MKAILAFLVILSTAMVGFCVYQITLGESLGLWYVLAALNVGNVILNSLALAD